MLKMVNTLLSTEQIVSIKHNNLWRVHCALRIFTCSSPCTCFIKCIPYIDIYTKLTQKHRREMLKWNDSCCLYPKYRKSYRKRFQSTNFHIWQFHVQIQNNKFSLSTFYSISINSSSKWSKWTDHFFFSANSPFEMFRWRSFLPSKC